MQGENDVHGEDWPPSVLMLTQESTIEDSKIATLDIDIIETSSS